MRSILIAVIILVLAQEISVAEIIDGPANIRSAPKGSILFSIKDKQQVNVIGQDGDWFLIDWVVEQPLSTLDGNSIKVNASLYDFGGHDYGKAIERVPINNPKTTSKGIQGNIRGYTHTKNIKKLKITIAEGASPEPGRYLIPEFVNRANKTYSISKAWKAPPFPAELHFRIQDKWYVFDVGDLHDSGLNFKLQKDGTVDDSYCTPLQCITEVTILSRDIISLKIGDKAYEFVNVEKYKSADKPGDLDDAY